MSIRERAELFAKEHATSMVGTVIEVEHMVEFAQAERALQRQEVADEFRHYCQGLSDPWEEKACNLILSAGTEPTNPFGCGCWRLTNNMWTRNDTATIGCFVVMPSDAAFCDRCGAKRRE